MGKPHAQRQSEIIQSALALAAEVGVSNVTTQAIADRVGIAQATVFRHFESRDAIFSGAIEWLAKQLFEDLAPCFESTDLPADTRLEMVIQRQLNLISRHRGLPRLLFSDRLHMESSRLKESVQKIVSRYLGNLTILIEDGVNSGCFRAELDAHKTATMVAALIQGTVMRWSLFDFKFKLEDESAEIQSFVIHSLLRPAQP